MKEEFAPLVISPIPVYPFLSVRNFYTVIYMTYSDGFIFSGERHAFRELTYVDEGSCVVTSDDVTYACGKGDLVLHAPGAFHSMRVEKNESSRLLTLSFDLNGPASGLFPGKYTLKDGERDIICRMIGQLRTLFGDGAYGDIKLTQAFSSVPADDVHIQMIRVLLELLCLSLTERGGSSREKPSTDPRALCYGRIMTFLNDNVNKNLTLGDVCRGVYESPGKVKDVFHRFAGGGIMKYFHTLRIGRIMELLGDGHSVKDTASLMDFSSPYYLSYYFKRETGMTVREYLQNRDAK